MRKMILALLALCLAAGPSFAAQAAQNTQLTRKSEDGKPLRAPEAGCKTARIGTTTHLAAATSPGRLYWLYMSSVVAQSDHVLLYDSTWTTTGNIATFYNLNVGTVSATAVNHAMIPFDPPLRFGSGLVLDHSVNTGYSVACFQTDDGTDD